MRKRERERGREREREREREEFGVAWHVCRLDYRSVSVLQVLIQITKETNTQY
jgi:hypothetical protein